MKFFKSNTNNQSSEDNIYESKPLNEVLLHFTPLATYVYHDYYERFFEGTIASPTSVVYLKGKDDSDLYYISGNYVIVSLKNEEDFKVKLRNKFQINEDSNNIIYISLM